MNDILLYQGKENCSACGACMMMCPKQAISMAEDEFGCKYPVINKELCIGCGKCAKSCAYQKLNNTNAAICAYAALSKDNELEQNSASGGVFASLAKSFIDNGGKVSGAIMKFSNGNADVYHILSDTEDGIHEMQGSKYVQSDAWKSYKDILSALKEGEKVLFCGTPCQVDAVKSVTGNPEELITIDLICHGVPPVKMLNDYFNKLSKRLGGNIIGFLFRDKTCRKQFCTKITIEKKQKNKTYFIPSYFVSYYKYFLDGTLYRENCYSCPYAKKERAGDITIGDYWGIEDCHVSEIESGIIDPKRSWSSVLVNTEKGNEFFATYGRNITVVKSEMELVAKTNKQLKSPSRKSDDRDNILNLYKKGGYKLVEKEFIRSGSGTLRYYRRLIREIYQNRRNE